MPYEITEGGCSKGKPFAVRKKGGEVIGCHETRASATRQLRALYANETKQSNGQLLSSVHGGVVALMAKELSPAGNGMDGLRPAPPELEAVVKKLIGEDFPYLSTKRIVLAVRNVAPRTAEGQSTVAATGVSTDPSDSFDYIFWFAWDVWQLLTSEQREAIVFHELMHCDSSKADSSGLRPHDASVFNEEVERYGTWWEQPSELYAQQNVNWNSVNWNSVNWNSVNWNSVNWNSVNWNSKDFQQVIMLAVNWNSVNWNSVNWNSAIFQRFVMAFVNWNSVNWNSVNWNSVNWNSEEFRNRVIAAVNWNSVNWNSVNWNSATFQQMIIAAVNWNSVNWNSVNWNSVNWNSVNWNSVNWNSVNWNSVNWNSFDWLAFSGGESLNKERFVEKTAIKREHGMDFPPRDYAYVPDPLLPATWKLRLTETPGKVTEAQLQKAAAALSPTGFRGNRLEIPAQTLASVKQRLRAEFRRLKVDESRIPMSVKEVEEEEFMVWKDVSTGLTRWFAIYSNNFRDQDNPSEIISEKSQETYVELVDEGIVDYPELWLWHVKGTAWGKADWVAYAHGFAMASGLVYPGYEYVAKNLAKRGNLRVSHGMIKPLLVYDPHDKSVIIFHVTAEISPLPDWAAANMLTGFTVLEDEGDNIMAKAKGLPEAKRSFLAEALGESVVANIESNLEKANDLATESGFESKSASEEGDTEIDGFDTSELQVNASDESEEEEEVPAVKETAKAKPYPKAEEIEEEMPKKKVAAKKKEAVAANVESSYVTREEVAEAMGVVLTPMMQTIETLTNHVATLTKEITALKEEDAEKIAATKELTPTLSLSELISRNVIGKEASKVKGSTVLGKDGPVETEAPTGPPPTMVPFINDMFARSSLGSA